MNIIISVLLLLILSWPVTSQASQLSVQQVKIIDKKSGSPKIAFTPVCGSKFYGFLTRSTQNGLVEVAALVERDDIACAKISEHTEITLDFITNKSTLKLTAMVLDRPVRARLASVTGIKNDSKDRTKLSLVYESSCRPVAGIILRRTNLHQVEIGVAEYINGEKCASHAVITKTKSLAFAPSVRLSALRRAQAASLQRHHHLRIAEIKPESMLQIGSQAGAIVTYRRRCNEAPVGLIIGRSRQNPQIGILVARYPNFHCPTNSATWTWSRLASPNLTFSNTPGIILPKAGRSSLHITPVAKYSKSRKGLQINYVRGCQASLGVVYALTNSGHLAIGILNAGDSSSCKEAPSEVSLTQTFVSPSSLTKDPIPLRIKG